MGPAFLWGNLKEFSSVFVPIAIPTRTDEAPAQEILNQALKEDALNDSYVRKLQISSRD